jgi:hypothetical protein
LSTAGQKAAICSNDPLSTQFSGMEEAILQVAEMYCLMKTNGERFLQ